MHAKWIGPSIGNAVWAWTLARASRRRVTIVDWLMVAASISGV